MSELGRRLGDWWVGQQSVWRCGMADWGEAGDENEDVDRSLLLDEERDISFSVHSDNI
jgi:hypothetical protein